jgi:hypothetical protein
MMACIAAFLASFEASSLLMLRMFSMAASAALTFSMIWFLALTTASKLSRNNLEAETSRALTDSKAATCFSSEVEAALAAPPAQSPTPPNSELYSALAASICLETFRAT